MTMLTGNPDTQFHEKQCSECGSGACVKLIAEVVAEILQNSKPEPADACAKRQFFSIPTLAVAENSAMPS